MKLECCSPFRRGCPNRRESSQSPSILVTGEPLGSRSCLICLKPLADVWASFLGGSLVHWPSGEWVTTLPQKSPRTFLVPPLTPVFGAYRVGQFPPQGPLPQLGPPILGRLGSCLHPS